MKKRNIAFCECGNPATVWTGDAKICDRCNDIEKRQKLEDETETEDSPDTTEDTLDSESPYKDW